ncbi:MAG: hypothetical protein ABFS32_22670 [Bacteroidota bacterium]
MKGKKNNILSFFIGAVISLIIVIAVLAVRMYLYMLTIGFEPIQDVDDYLRFYIIPAIMIVAVLGVYRLFKKRKRFTSYGILVSLLPILFIVYLNAVDLVSYLKPVHFSEELWNSSVDKPYTDARALIENDLLVGKTRAEVIDILGENYNQTHTNDTIIVYRLEIARFAYLRIDIGKNDTVQNVGFWYHD